MADAAPPSTQTATSAPGAAYEIRVMGRRRAPRTASTQVVTARELSAVPRRTAEDALRLVSGFTLVQHGSEGKGHQFFSRGFDAVHGADFAVRVDGVPVNEWSNIHAQGYIDLGFIIPEAIDSVRVTKGPFALEQGAFAMAGSAEYRLGIAEGARGLRLAYTGGSTNRHRGVVTYSPADGDGADFVALEALHDDGFGANREIERGSFLSKVRLHDSPRTGTLSLLAAAYFARFELPGSVRNQDVESGDAGFYDAYDSAGRGRSARGLLTLAYDWTGGAHRVRSRAWAGYRHLDLLENYTGFLFDPVRGDRRRQMQDSWQFGGDLGYDVRLGPTLVLESGLGVRADALDQAQDRTDQSEVAFARDRALTGGQALAHARVGLRWRPVSALRVAAGARVDVAHVAVQDAVLPDEGTARGTRAAVSPRLTAQWRIATPWTVFAAYGRGFRPFEARAFTSFATDRTGIAEDLFVGGAPAMSVSDAWEIGSRWVPNRYLGLTASGFATRIERESVFDHVSGLNLDLNATRRLGAEVEVRSSPLDGLSLVGAVTFADARFAGSGRLIPFAPRWTSSFRAVFDHSSGLRAGLRVFALAPRPLPHDARGATLAQVDVTLGRTFGPLRLDLQVENLFNQRIREGEYHYASHWRPGAPASALPTIHFVAGPPLNVRLTAAAVF